MTIMWSASICMLEVAAELKNRRAHKIFVFSTFGLFTSGLDKFDRAYEEGIIDRVLTTNLIYQTPELSPSCSPSSAGPSPCTMPRKTW